MGSSCNGVLVIVFNFYEFYSTFAAAEENWYSSDEDEDDQKPPPPNTTAASAPEVVPSSASATAPIIAPDMAEVLNKLTAEVGSPCFITSTLFCKPQNRNTRAPSGFY